jgi:hypothetical protein
VLPQWRDEVVAYIAPHRVALARINRGLRPRVVASVESTLESNPAANPQAAFARLAELIADSQWQHAAARVVLADAWVRYGIVPAPAVNLDADGQLSHARYVLADHYGDTLSDWSITLTDVPPGRPYVVCATPSPLRSELSDVLAAAQLSLISLQPQLVVSFNAWRTRLPADESWFVSIDEGSLAAVHVVGGEWQRVHTVRLSSDWTVELQRLRAFGRYTESQAGAGQLYIDAPVSMRTDGRRALPELGWLEPDARQERMPVLNVLQRVVA